MLEGDDGHGWSPLKQALLAGEKAEAEHRRLVRTAFGHQGSLPPLHGPCRVDEAMLPHTALLLDRSFWLTSSVSKLPKAPPPTPWISPSPPKLREVVSSRASQQGKKGGVKGGFRRGKGKGSSYGEFTSNFKRKVNEKTWLKGVKKQTSKPTQFSKKSLMARWRWVARQE